MNFIDSITPVAYILAVRPWVAIIGLWAYIGGR
jgi:hypothetical protein